MKKNKKKTNQPTNKISIMPCLDARGASRPEFSTNARACTHASTHCLEKNWSFYRYSILLNDAQKLK
ncbi:Golgin subfamily A member [Trichinella pseudospiralis]